MIRDHQTQYIEIEEAFIPPSLYPQVRKRPDCPDLSQFPNGIYILGKWGFSEILAISPTPQLDAIKKEQEIRQSMPSRFERARRRHLRQNPRADELQKVRFHETFVPPDKYDEETQALPGMPDLKDFPNGIYILGYNNFEKIVGFFPESQLKKMIEINAELEKESENNGAANGRDEVLPVLPGNAPDSDDSVRGSGDIDLSGSDAGHGDLVRDAGPGAPWPARIPVDNAAEGRQGDESAVAASPDTQIYHKAIESISLKQFHAETQGKFGPNPIIIDDLDER